MNMYKSPIEGCYTRKRPDFNGGFYKEQVKVLVIGESDKSLLIQLRCNIDGHRCGERLKVRKHNVNMSRPENLISVSSGIGTFDKPRREYDYSNEFWNN